jgi:hypothetical protein
LVLFAVFWAVRGQPTYIGVVSATVLGTLWLLSLVGFLVFFSLMNKYYTGAGAL